MLLMTDGDVATHSVPLYDKYISSELGYKGEIKSPCSLDKKFIYVSLAPLFTKVNPLVNQFNTILRRVLEAEIASRYWNN